ncbi:hypothetical protein H5410_061461 [Solanum commersonii]|uniref:Uncharacterized protein n=1 Tax=Solanum commersonii TaxID=4109 RepID=A0A9J5W8P2_SOLCO|nr:hypothetical protein H5410_061461 [Solanum commersonii]
MALIKPYYMKMVIESIHGLSRYVQIYLTGIFPIGFVDGGHYMARRWSDNSETIRTLLQNIVNFNDFSKLFENDTALVTTQHVYVMIKQNNYANIYMSILGEHIISLHDKVDKIIYLLPTKIKGKEKIAHSSLQPPLESEDFKIKDYSDLEKFLEKRFTGGVQPINADNFSEGELSYVNNNFSDDINKILEKYARKPVQMMFYYPGPSPQDVLLEELEHIITNSYNGKEIYEWNIDGYTDR